MDVPEQLGPYRLGETLGRGGMGTVYRATHVETGTEVAVKVLAPRLSTADGFRDRFESEVESLKTLRHASIVRLFGYGEEEGVMFYAMELVEGPSLEEELQAGRRFDWRETTQIAIQIARALKHAHDHGVIHRDLKPANILLAASARPKLADFGVARVFGATSVTLAGGVLGTADYMAPEQAAGKPVGARCDQYSLGGVIYALLAGRPPFRADNVPAMLQLQRFAVPEPVSRFAPDTPKELERLLAKLLEKDPGDRFPNTEVLARRLEEMAAALARVAADDFELSRTRAQPPTPDAGDNESMDTLAYAPTRDADEVTPAPRAASRPAPSLGASMYTPVEPRESGAEAPSRWASVLGQVAVLAVAVVTLIGAVWWFSQPLSADALYDRIAPAGQSNEPSAYALSAVEEFLDAYPDDPRRDEVEAWATRLRLERMRRKMVLTSKLTPPREELTPQRELLRLAAESAGRDPEAGADTYLGLAELFTHAPSKPGDEPFDRIAREEATRLREETRRKHEAIAEFCLPLLEKARATRNNDPAAARAAARAVLDLLPSTPETRETLDAARALLSAAGSADGQSADTAKP